MTGADSDLLDLSRFSGWVRFAELPTVEVPTDAGVYVVVRPSDEAPQFCATVPYRGDSAFPVADLEDRWVPGARIIYIGKAQQGSKRDGLRRRLRQFRRYGAGHSARHAGGRAIWQLADYPDLRIGWRVTADDEARPTERAMIAQFRSRYQARPFGNGAD